MAGDLLNLLQPPARERGRRLVCNVNLGLEGKIPRGIPDAHNVGAGRDGPLVDIRLPIGEIVTVNPHGDVFALAGQGNRAQAGYPGWTQADSGQRRGKTL